MPAIKRTSVATPFEMTPLAAAAIRADARGIEKNLPWPLDMTFDEDRCRARNDISARNLAIVRQMVFKILKREEPKLSLARRRW
jgi:predicted transposase YbfD/YdcC